MTYRADSLKRFFFFLLVVFQKVFFLRTSFMFTGRTCAHLNWRIIRQTHQTSRLLQWQSSQRESLIKYVSSQQGDGKRRRQACDFTPNRDSVAGDERLEMPFIPFIFSTVTVQCLKRTNWMHVILAILKVRRFTYYRVFTALCQWRTGSKTWLASYFPTFSHDCSYHIWEDGWGVLFVTNWMVPANVRQERGTITIWLL